MIRTGRRAGKVRCDETQTLATAVAVGVSLLSSAGASFSWRMRSHAGVAAKLFETLGREGINVRLVSTSEIKISVLVAEMELERAVRALHKAYGLEHG